MSLYYVILSRSLYYVVGDFMPANSQDGTSILDRILSTRG